MWNLKTWIIPHLVFVSPLSYLSFIQKFALLNNFGKICLFFWVENLKQIPITAELQEGLALTSLDKQSTLITVFACWLKAVLMPNYLRAHWCGKWLLSHFRPHWEMFSHQAAPGQKLLGDLERQEDFNLALHKQLLHLEGTFKKLWHDAGFLRGTLKGLDAHLSPLVLTKTQCFQGAGSQKRSTIHSVLHVNESSVCSLSLETWWLGLPLHGF